MPPPVSHSTAGAAAAGRCRPAPAGSRPPAPAPPLAPAPAESPRCAATFAPAPPGPRHSAGPAPPRPPEKPTPAASSGRCGESRMVASTSPCMAKERRRRGGTVLNGKGEAETRRIDREGDFLNISDSGRPRKLPETDKIRPPMRRILLTALPWLLLALTGCEPEQQAQPERRRLTGAAKGWNVVLLTVDTLRADRLGAYGYAARANSPRLDAQLASGVLFADAQSQRASTWPSLASLLTGLYPSGHGVAENGYGFPDDLPTLPKILHGAGYRTGAFLSNMCRANHQAWDAFSCTGGNDGKATRNALAWAGDLQGDKPFLLWLHLFGAHGPYYNGGDGGEKLDPG